MNQPPTTLADFSQFTIQQIVERSDRTFVSGRVTKPGRLWLGQHLCLFISVDVDVPSVVTEFDPDATNVILD